MRGPTGTEMPIENAVLTKRLIAAATGWREAARAILSVRVESVVLWPPFYCSLLYSIEMSLKAYLASRGSDRTELKRVGHNLKDLVNLAAERGLPVADQRLTIFIVQASEKLLELRYLEGDEIELVEPEEILSVVDAHFVQLARAIPISALFDVDITAPA